MFITKTKTKNTTIYYLSKSFRDRSTGKVTTKIVEKIGTEDEIKKKIGNKKPIEKWLKDYAVTKTGEERQTNKGATITLRSSAKKENIDRKIYNAGYLIIQKICYELELDKICKDIEKKEKFKGDLFQILTYIIYTYNANFGKNIDVLTFAQTFIQQPNFNRRQFHLALEIIAKYAYQIQYKLFDKINKYTKADNSIVYYDTNYFYHDFVNPDEDFKNLNEHDKILKYEVGYNSKNVPLAYSTYKSNGNYDEYDIKLGKKILKDCSSTIFIVLSSFENPYTSLIVANQRENTSPIRWINIRELKKEHQKWATDNEGWTEVNTQQSFTMDEIKKKINDPNIVKNNNEWIKNSRFYKTKKIKWKDEKTEITSEKILVAIFSNDLKDDRIKFNKHKIENINATINKELFKHRNDIDYCKKFLKKYDKYIDINTEKLTSNKSDLFYCYTFKNNVITKLTEFSGFYTFLIDSPAKNLQDTIRAQVNKWLNDYTFRTVANDFYTLPKYIKYEDRQEAHMFTSFLSILIWRILQYKSNYKFSDEQLTKGLNNFNFIYMNGEGWIPCYEMNNISKFFQKIIGHETDFAFITTKQMNNIIKSMKKQ